MQAETEIDRGKILRDDELHFGLNLGEFHFINFVCFHEQHFADRLAKVELILRLEAEHDLMIFLRSYIQDGGKVEIPGVEAEAVADPLELRVLLVEFALNLAGLQVILQGDFLG